LAKAVFLVLYNPSLKAWVNEALDFGFSQAYFKN